MYIYIYLYTHTHIYICIDICICIYTPSMRVYTHSTAELTASIQLPACVGTFSNLDKSGSASPL